MKWIRWAVKSDLRRLHRGGEMCRRGIDADQE